MGGGVITTCSLHDGGVGTFCRFLGGGGGNGGGGDGASAVWSLGRGGGITAWNRVCVCQGWIKQLARPLNPDCAAQFAK